MPSYNIGKYYEKGRRNWLEDVKAKRTHETQMKKEERGFKARESMLEREGEMERGKLQYGAGSPAERQATTAEGELGLGRQRFGWEQQFKPWEAAAKQDIERRKLQGQGTEQSTRADTQAIFKWEEENLDLSDPTSVKQANRIRRASGMREWIPMTEEVKPKSFLGINLGGGGARQTFREETLEEYQQRMGQGQPQTQQPHYAPPGGVPQPIPQAQVPPGYSSAPSAPMPGQGIPLNQPPAPYTQPQGGGTMTVEGQPGHYGINMPGGGGTPISPGYPGIKRYGGEGKQLDQATAQEFLKQAGGDPEKARKMAREQGFTF